MTEEQIKAIKARLDAATPGLWYRDPGGSIGTASSEWVAQTFSRRDEDFENAENNGEFIAHAPADVAALLSEVERLRRLIYEYNRAPLGSPEEEVALAYLEDEGTGPDDAPTTTATE
jgi:hypothetical protein